MKVKTNRAVKVWNHGQVIYQTAIGDGDVPNEAILAHIDNGGTIALQQGGDTLVIDKGTVPDLIGVLKTLEKAKD